MQLSYKTLASKEFHKQLLDDIDNLLTIASDRKLIPILLVVGPVFLEVTVVQYIKSELNVSDWEFNLKIDQAKLSQAIYSKKLELYNDCLNNLGKFARDSERNIDVFFDPAEAYISLKCVDRINKPKHNEIKTKDGHLVCSLYYRPEEILTDFIFDIF